MDDNKKKPSAEVEINVNGWSSFVGLMLKRGDLSEVASILWTKIEKTISIWSWNWISNNVAPGLKHDPRISRLMIWMNPWISSSLCSNNTCCSAHCARPTSQTSVTAWGPRHHRGPFRLTAEGQVKLVFEVSVNGSSHLTLTPPGHSMSSARSCYLNTMRLL